MFDAGRRLAAITRGLMLAAMLTGMAWGQGAQPSVPSQDVFAAWQGRLSEAADTTLAAAVADKPWMKTREAAAGGGTSETTVAIDRLARVRTAIERVQRLRPVIEPILRQEGVPSELSAIVLVESGGEVSALSPKGARGVWQFMPATARRYGLAVTAERDERIEVVKSTRAAARYLRDLYQQFGDWQLAFAAYNAGEQAVERAAARAGQRNFSGIQHALPQETRDYVPAVLKAIAVLGSNRLEVLRAVNGSRTPAGRLLYASVEKPE